MKQFSIEQWSPNHPRWAEYEAYLKTADLYYVLEGIVNGGVLPVSHFLAALEGEELIGILLFLTQPIGPEMDLPVIHGRNGEPLLEAKIRSFHVLENKRNRGIGTALQQEAIHLAQQLGCYQVRSRSELTKQANYAIKIKLGFVMHPAIRELSDGTNSPGVYWMKKI